MNFQGRLADEMFIVVERFDAMKVCIPFQAIIYEIIRSH